MKPTKMDPFLLISRDVTSLKRVGAFQVADSFGHGDQDVVDKEKHLTSKKLKTKPRVVMKRRDNATINGRAIHILERSIYYTFANKKPARSKIGE